MDQILVEQVDVIEQPRCHEGMHAGLEFEQDVDIEPVRSPAQPPDDVTAAFIEPVVDKFGGIFFQGAEIDLADPVLADEADQQVANHFGMGKQPFVAMIVVGHGVINPSPSAAPASLARDRDQRLGQRRNPAYSNELDLLEANLFQQGPQGPRREELDMPAVP